MTHYYIFILVMLLPSQVLAYIGPGAGLGMMGSLIAILFTFIAALGGVIYLPIKTLIKRLLRKNNEHD